MRIVIESRRRGMATIERTYPDALVLDVTSKAAEPWIRFSPFYPHGDIPVPYSPGVTSQTVEGIWQALKVFESADVDESKLKVANMKGIKRSVRSNGPVLGHRMGLAGKKLLPYIDARRLLYLPSYLWVLDHKVPRLVDELRELTRERDLVLLDYSTNGDVGDASRPLSHAALLRRHLVNDWPT